MNLKQKEEEMTSKNVVNATIIFEFDNGEYAITGTKNQAVIRVCCEFLQFKRLPEKYFRNLSIDELVLEDKE